MEGGGVRATGGGEGREYVSACECGGPTCALEERQRQRQRQTQARTKKIKALAKAQRETHSDVVHTYQILLPELSVVEQPLLLLIRHPDHPPLAPTLFASTCPLAA